VRISSDRGPRWASRWPRRLLDLLSRGEVVDHVGSTGGPWPMTMAAIFNIVCHSVGRSLGGAKSGGE
jgi:hypothetical protein